MCIYVCTSACMCVRACKCLPVCAGRDRPGAAGPAGARRLCPSGSSIASRGFMAVPGTRVCGQVARRCPALDSFSKDKPEFVTAWHRVVGTWRPGRACGRGEGKLPAEGLPRPQGARRRAPGTQRPRTPYYRVGARGGRCEPRAGGRLRSWLVGLRREGGAARPSLSKCQFPEVQRIGCHFIP